MTYNVFSGTLNPTQSINQLASARRCRRLRLEISAAQRYTT